MKRLTKPVDYRYPSTKESWLWVGAVVSLIFYVFGWIAGLPQLSAIVWKQDRRWIALIIVITLVWGWSIYWMFRKSGRMMEQRHNKVPDGEIY